MKNTEYWRLVDEEGKPPGLLGWWPSKATTFIDNHDTGPPAFLQPVCAYSTCLLHRVLCFVA